MSPQNMQTGDMEGEPTPEEIMSALFANMVIQNTNMALMFLGKVPHPQTGQPIKDLESAQMFIDQLEMLAYKTRGNLGNEEKQLLQQSLISLRMTFVEELRRAGIPVPEHLTEQMEQLAAQVKKSEAPAPPPQAVATQPSPDTAPAPAPTTSSAPPPSAAPTPAPAEEESRKRFTKKY